MNPKLLEIWKEVKYDFKATDYLVILGFGVASLVSSIFNKTIFMSLFGTIFLFQIVKLFAVSFTDHKLVEDKNIERAKRIFFKLKKEPKDDLE